MDWPTPGTDRRRRWAAIPCVRDAVVLVVGFWAWIGPLGVFASAVHGQVRPTRVTVTITDPASRGSCRDEALAAARLQAVLERASTTGRALIEPWGASVTADAIVGEREVDFERVAGGCRLTADFRVNTRAVEELEQSLLAEQVPRVPIGVLVRYQVDGALATQAGLNSRQATTELETALADYGYTLVSLAAAQEDYDRLLQATERAFTHAEDEQATRRLTDEGGIQAGLLEDMRAHLENAAELEPMRACGGLVLFGELRVDDQGANPYGQGSVAAARLLLQIQRLDNSQPVVLPANETRQVVGIDPGVARDKARSAVIEPVARQIAGELARMPPAELDQCATGRFR